jgi:hypothetical protein
MNKNAAKVFGYLDAVRFEIVYLVKIGWPSFHFERYQKIFEALRF